MADIFDYISWRGDLTFEQDGFNELDALVLSRLSILLVHMNSTATGNDPL